MQRILTAEQAREADRLTTQKHGIPGIVLMENAGSRVYGLLAHRFSPLSQQRIIILCGKGNNGGDGLVVARLIAIRQPDARPHVLLFADPEDLKGDAAANYKVLRGVDVEPYLVTSAAAWRTVKAKLLSATVVVDALLGIGLDGPVHGFLAQIIRDVNKNCKQATIVAVDMPSGLPSDSGDPTGEILHADHTVTFTAPKVSQIFPPNCERIGQLAVVPIGTTLSLLDSLPGSRLSLIEASDVAPLFAPRSPSSHKGDFGHVLVVAGSRAKPGAAIMTGTAALRAGAGLVTVATAAGAVNAVVAHTPELMTEPAAELEDGSIGIEAFRSTWLDRKTVVAIGPGLGTVQANQELVLRLVREVKCPLVVDADGITALAAIKEKDWQCPKTLMVLTPHPGEMSRLTGLSVKEISARRVEVARSFARKHGVYLVLKGFRTLIAGPDDHVVVNPTGTPAMAKGGSGDILTGLIAGFLAQFVHADPAIVIAAAVYLHGLAAEISAKSEQTLLATDILDTLPEAITVVRG